MTKEKFIRIQKNRGYKVEELGNMVRLTLGKYTAIHFFKADGSVDESQPAFWKLDR